MISTGFLRPTCSLVFTAIQPLTLAMIISLLILSSIGSLTRQANIHENWLLVFINFPILLQFFEPVLAITSLWTFIIQDVSPQGFLVRSSYFILNSCNLLSIVFKWDSPLKRCFYFTWISNCNCCITASHLFSLPKMSLRMFFNFWTCY